MSRSNMTRSRMKPPSTFRSMLQGERGSITILMALLLPVFLGFAALVVDLGLGYTNRRALQNAADAAALASAGVLSQSWTGTQITATSAQATAAVTSYVQANMLPKETATFQIEFLDKNKAIIPLSASTRGVRVTTKLTQPSLFGRILGVDSLMPGAKAAAEFGPAGSGKGVSPIAVDDSVSNLYRLQPAGGNSDGNYVNVALINTAAFGSQQDFFDALENGMRDPVVLGQSYVTSAPDWVRWRKSVVDALNKRIDLGSSYGDTPTHYRANSPQVLIVPTVQGGFGNGGSPVKLYRFRAFFLQRMDPAGNWAKGVFLNNVSFTQGAINQGSPYGGVTALRLVE